MVETLAGFTVGITGHRRWEEQAELLTRRGARVVHGPTMRTDLLNDSAATLEATQAALAAPLDIVVLTTGIGTRSWFVAAEGGGLDDALHHALAGALLVARGPKAASAARAVGLEPAWIAHSETIAEVRDILVERGVAGRRIAVQRDGGQPQLAAELAAHGADVIDVPVYSWALPDDLAPARRVLDAACVGALDALTFTCSYAVDNAFAICDDPIRLAAGLNEAVLAVAVGPVTAGALARHGVTRVIEPARARLGSMLHALSAALEARHCTLRHGEHAMRWQGCALVDAAGTIVELTRGEVRMLLLLAGAAPSVVAKSELVEPGADEHAAEVAMARLRARLGPLGDGIRTVRRRGYAFAITVESAGARAVADAGRAADGAPVVPDGRVVPSQA